MEIRVCFLLSFFLSFSRPFWVRVYMQVYVVGVSMCSVAGKNTVLPTTQPDFKHWWIRFVRSKQLKRSRPSSDMSSLISTLFIILSDCVVYIFFLFSSFRLLLYFPSVILERHLRSSWKTCVWLISLCQFRIAWNISMRKRVSHAWSLGRLSVVLECGRKAGKHLYLFMLLLCL